MGIPINRLDNSMSHHKKNGESISNFTKLFLWVLSAIHAVIHIIWSYMFVSFCNFHLSQQSVS